ncbi:MAG: alpha/beta hydrolase [Bacteroidetes bacterium]|nr:alpha/beta hydrolase [Bacteroidota bacterium]
MFRKLLRLFGWLLGSILVLLIVLGIVFYQKDQSPEEVYKKYALASSQQIAIGGVQLHYSDEGNRLDSTPLLLIHGTSSSLRTWDGVTAQLKNQYRIIRFDLPGFGLTGPNPNHDYTTRYYNEVIDSLLKALQISRVIIVGNSLGGAIATQYAIYQPAKVRGLVLVDAAGLPPAKKTTGAIGFKLAQMPVINQLLTIITPRVLVKKSLQDAYGDTEKVTDSLTTQYFDMLTREGNRKALVDRMRQGWLVTDGNFLTKVQATTLIVWGSQDRLIPVENAALFQQKIKNSQVHIWDNLGHVPMEEDPVAFSDILRKWVMQLK